MACRGSGVRVPSDPPKVGPGCDARLVNPAFIDVFVAWHLREGDALRLYMDGELVQESADPQRIPLGLQLVMGQLYTETVERFFIGHVDEVAIYDRPLKPQEIATHYQLLRPAKAPSDRADRGRDAI